MTPGEKDRERATAVFDAILQWVDASSSEDNREMSELVLHLAVDFARAHAEGRAEERAAAGTAYLEDLNSYRADRADALKRTEAVEKECTVWTFAASAWRERALRAEAALAKPVGGGT